MLKYAPFCICLLWLKNPNFFLEEFFLFQELCIIDIGIKLNHNIFYKHNTLINQEIKLC